jgi:hypothetical protein
MIAGRRFWLSCAGAAWPTESVTSQPRSRPTSGRSSRRATACYEAPSRVIVRQLTAGIRADYADLLPSALACFEDFEACIAHLNCQSRVDGSSGRRISSNGCSSRSASAIATSSIGRP